MIGVIMFVGELLVRKLVNRKFVYNILDQIIRAYENYKTGEILEGLCVFLETVGPALDTPDWKEGDDFKKIFVKLLNFTKMDDPETGKKLVETRLRFKIQDLCELKANNWKGKSTLGRTAKPKTLQEVAEETAAKQGQQQQAHLLGDRRQGPSVQDLKNYGGNTTTTATSKIPAAPGLGGGPSGVAGGRGIGSSVRPLDKTPVQQPPQAPKGRDPEAPAASGGGASKWGGWGNK